MDIAFPFRDEGLSCSTLLLVSPCASRQGPQAGSLGRLRECRWEEPIASPRIEPVGEMPTNRLPGHPTGLPYARPAAKGGETSFVAVL